MFELAMVSNPEAAVAGMFLLAATLISGAIAYASSRKPKEAPPEPPKPIDYTHDRTGDTATSIWFKRFDTLERMHLWTLFVLVGQGFAFSLFSLFVRQESLTNTHRTNDRLDRIQTEVTQGAQGTQRGGGRR